MSCVTNQAAGNFCWHGVCFGGDSGHQFCSTVSCDAARTGFCNACISMFGAKAQQGSCSQSGHGSGNGGHTQDPCPFDCNHMNCSQIRMPACMQKCNFSSDILARCGAGGGVGPPQPAAQVEFDLVQTLRSQLGTDFVNQNETCIRNAIHQFSTNFMAMQHVSFNGPDYNNYKNGLLTALKANFICIFEGGGKAGGAMACTGGREFGVCAAGGRPHICDVDCNNLSFFDIALLPANCLDTNCCRQQQMAANCAAYGAGGGGGGMMMGGGGGAECLGIPGVNCGQLGLIGAVLIFGLFILVVVKR